jgi:very-short-patch-repair endonuclease
MAEGAASNPPRNGEGDRPRVSGGGGEADSRRVRHRTVGANPENIKFARALRRKMTLPEVLLWQVLRKRPAGLKFRKQFPHHGFVIDFACLERRLTIEVDGEVHSMGDIPRRDAKRDAQLAEAGFATLRIAARDVLRNLQGVLTLIIHTCENRPLHHDAVRRGPPPRSGEDL